MPCRILLVALDAADAGLVQLMMARGRAPNLSRLSQTCAQATVIYPHGQTDDALWASFQYALPLGEHGRYHWQRPQPQGGPDRIGSEGEAELVAFWESPELHGARVAMFDMPKARPTAVAGSLHLTHWRAHGRYGDQALSNPPEIADDVITRFGAYDEEHLGDPQEHLSDLLASIAAKRDAAIDYMKRDNWDLFATTFHELHTASHIFWPAPTVALDSLPFDHMLFRILEATDTALGELIAAAGPETRICVFSTTGMAPNRSVEHLGAGIATALNSQLANTQERFGRLLGQRPLFQPLPYNENAVALRLAPGMSRKRRTSLLDHAQQLIMELRDTQTGERIFSDCQTPSRDLAGARALDLPDLLFLPGALAAAPTKVFGPRLGPIAATVRFPRPGNHLGNGVCWHSHELDMTSGSGTLHMHEFGKALARAVGERERLSEASVASGASLLQSHG